jgi:hypothetical protein
VLIAAANFANVSFGMVVIAEAIFSIVSFDIDDVTDDVIDGDKSWNVSSHDDVIV